MEKTAIPFPEVKPGDIVIKVRLRRSFVTVPLILYRWNTVVSTLLIHITGEN